MSTPRTKRQFAGAASDPAQRQITSYFNKTSSDGAPGASPRAPAGDGCFPAPPATVQADLLMVGMRVRRSVPGGYKTGSDSGGYSLWQDSPTSNSGNWTSSHNNRPVPALPSSGVPEPNQRELTPFCGIHKVGGLAVQPSTDIAFPVDTFVLAEDGDFKTADSDILTDPASSQESVASTDSVSSASASLGRVRHLQNLGNLKKRGHGPDGHADDADVPTMVRGSVRITGWENSRVMAIPRRKTANKGPGEDGSAKATAVSIGDQENTMTLDDFEEATFLQGRDGMDCDI